MSERKADPDKITALVKAGLTNAQIAEELDCVPATVRRWVREMGLVGNWEVYRNVRDRAEDMPPTQAKDYLLDVLALLHEAMVFQTEHEVDTWGIHLTPTERRILICLVDARGAVRAPEEHAEAQHQAASASRSPARSRADRARGLMAVSASPGPSGFVVSSARRGACLAIASAAGACREGLAARPAASAKARLTILSSSE